MSESINPYAPPAAKLVSLSQDTLEIWTIFVSAWNIFRARFVVIAAIGMLVWTPCEMFSSYMDYFVFDPDEFKAPFHFNRLLYYLFGVIATAGVVHVALRHSSDATITVGQTLRAGLNAWLRMGWTVFLTAAFLVFSFVLLVLPFFYLLPRLILVDSVVVCEGLSGNAAIERSFALTRGHYWKLLGFVLITIGIMCAWLVLPWALAEFFDLPDHWLLDAFWNTASGIISAYETILMFCVYRVLSQPPAKADQA